MSKLGQIADMAFNGKKAELLDYLETKMSKKAAKIGADEFMRAAKEITEHRKKDSEAKPRKKG